ncbi:unnamed protein product [Somion occarium]
MANRILPAVKRYAVGTEPVREAAKFWTTFFEQAAQIRVPTYEDYSLHQEAHTETGSSVAPDSSQAESDRATKPTRSFNPDGTSSEVSFMPGQAISSTPAATMRQRSQRGHDSFSRMSDETPSWSASLESPLIRLDREIQSLGQDDAVSVASSSLAQLSLRDDQSMDSEADITQRPVQQQGDDTFLQQQSEKSKGKGRESSQPLLHNVLLRNASSVDTSSTPGHSSISPLKLKGKTPILKKLNPYLPPDANPSDWQGIVDLKDPSMRSPVRAEPSPAKNQRFTFHPPSTTNTVTKANFKRPATPRRTKPADDDDSFEDGFGMSPPITMDFARLPKLGQTPRKEAAARIMNKLLDVERRGVFGGTGSATGTNTRAGTGKGTTEIRASGQTTTESSMSSMVTPPSLSRYVQPAETSHSSVVDASLESLMRRVGSGFDYGQARPQASVIPSSTSSYPSATTIRNPEISQASSSSASHPTLSAHSQPEDLPRTPEYPHFNMMHLKDDELQPPNQMDDDDFSSDSLDAEELNDTANPSAAFILASQRASYDDDSSFESNDSLDADDADLAGLGLGEAPVHPFARGLSAEEIESMENAGFEDSFDDDDDPIYAQQAEETEEETLFGVPPAQRLEIQARQEAQRQQQQLRMLGEHLLEDTMGIGAQMAGAGRIEETPTPWMGGRGA